MVFLVFFSKNPNTLEVLRMICFVHVAGHEYQGTEAHLIVFLVQFSILVAAHLFYVTSSLYCFRVVVVSIWRNR